MSFEDLPDNWPTLPLTDPRLVADVLDLVVPLADRETGALAVLMCDGEGRLVQPVIVDELPPGFTMAECEQALDVFREAMGTEGGALHLAIARPEGLGITFDDRVWVRAAERVCQGPVRLLGVHVITLAGSRTVPPTRKAA